MFSILLALAVNSYVDARKDRRLTDRALRGIRDELQANLQTFRHARPYHDTLSQEILAIDTTHEATSYVAFRRHAPGWRGFHNPQLDGTAWQSAVSLGTVANMGYDTVRVLSSAYEFQSKFDQYAAASIPTFDFADAAMQSTIRRMYVFVETMGIDEDTLAARYTKALNLLGAPSAAPAPRH